MQYHEEAQIYETKKGTGLDCWLLLLPSRLWDCE